MVKGLGCGIDELAMFSLWLLPMAMVEYTQNDSSNGGNTLDNIQQITLTLSI